MTVPAVDICIVGAGVIGLAVARELGLAFPSKDIILLEQHAQVGQETSSRNSEVIHAGIYYAPDSLKARCCVRGRELLYRYCEDQQIPHRRLGKLLVAALAEQEILEQIQNRAAANGVNSLQFLSTRHLRQLEPDVHADIALWSPDTGIVDSHSLMQQFLREAESLGVTLALRTVCQRVEVLQGDHGFRLWLQSGQDAMKLDSRVLINCAGLHAATVAAGIDALKPELIPQFEWIKGNYISYSGKSPFSHLIYPVPDPLQRGLGIHATLDIAGQCRFGPDTEAIKNLEYTVDNKRISLFSEAIRKYYPDLDERRLSPAYAGIRPRLKSTTNGVPDFQIQDETVHQVAGLWQLFGIESPGLTASMALAETVRESVTQSGRL